MTSSVSPFDRDALWSKAKNFINRSFDALDDADFPTAAMWAAIALELLGKAALANVNPCLIADPSDDGVSLLIAAGMSQDFSKAKSIQAKGVFSRCRRAFQPFDSDEADRIAKARNEELHSGLMPFDSIRDQDAWWQRYWAQAVILIDAQREDIADFVGAKRAPAVQRQLDDNAKHVQQYASRRIAEAKDRWDQALASSSAAADLSQLIRRLPMFLMSFSSAVTCPACGNTGSLIGEEVASSEVEYDHETGEALELLAVFPEVFECQHCGLLLEGQRYLDAAGLDELISDEREYEPEWDDYGND